jgi:hypothetical protein
MKDQPINLPGWKRLLLQNAWPNLGAASIRAHDRHFGPHWTVSFQPPKDWEGRKAVKNPGWYLWMPVDQALPVPTNPEFWTSDNPVLSTGPITAPSRYADLTAALAIVLDEMNQAHANAVIRALKSGNEATTDPACIAWGRAFQILRDGLSPVYP